MTSSDGVKFSHLVSKIVVVEARSGPHEPCGGDHHQNSSDLIHQYDESLERVGRHLRRDQSDLPRWAVAGRLQIERRLLSF